MQAPRAQTGGRTRKGRRAGAARSPFLRRWLRRILFALALVVLIPIALVPIYRLSFVHPVSTLMIADLAALRGYERDWTALDDIGPVVVHSVMMSEDGQFCAHHGIDLGEMRAVLEELSAGERPRGASTIPMQSVKNLFLWPGRSYLRKALEAPLAIYYDAVLPKRRIMEIYLNIAEWAPGVYGVEAAAQHYFGRPTRNLTARQAALLAVTLPDPADRNPARPTAGLNRLASVIEARARRSGAYIQCLE